MVDGDSLGSFLARDVFVTRGGRRVLRGATLTASVGVTTILGPNGAGKTTLLECVAGQLKPDAGEALGFTFAGSAAQARIGYVPQDPVLPEGLVVAEALGYAAWLRGVAWADTAQATRQALDAVDLSERAGDRIRSLSGGMKRRLSIAAGLVHDPAVLLLDESLVGLDPEQRIDMCRLLRAIGERIPVVLTTHVLSDLPDLGGRATILDEGVLSDPVPVDSLGGEGPVTVERVQAWYLDVRGAVR